MRAGGAGSRPSSTLLRILGLSFGLAVVVGGTIGVGILRTPGAVVARAGSAPLALSLWLLGGAYSLLGAIVLAELGTMMPQAGGYLVYSRRAFGSGVGFAVGWADLLVQCSALAYLSIAVGDFAVALIPDLAPAKAVALLTLLLFAGLHWAGLRPSSRAQEVMSALKTVGFIGLALACFAAASSGPATTSRQVWPGGGLMIALVLGFQLVIGTYGGWAGAIYFTEEDTDPARHLPRSLIGGVVILTVVYMLVNLSLMAVLPVDRLAASILPAGDAAAVVFGSRAGQIVTALSLVSLLGIINPILMIATRIVFALGRHRGGAVAAVSARGTPETALLIVTAAAATLIVTGTFEKLFAMTAFFITVVYLSSVVALIRLRQREPGTVRPFRAWGYPWTGWLVLLGSLGFLVGAVAGDPKNSFAALLLLGLSWPLSRMG